MEIISAILQREPKSLRETLASTPRELEAILARCLRKDVNRRLQHIGDARILLEEVREDMESGKLPADEVAVKVVKPTWIAGLVAAAALLAGGFGMGLGWWLKRLPGPAPGLALTRLTSDSGLTTDPAISPDGKLIAYASDRSGPGNLDIWVQQIPGGQLVRITRHEADDREPVFSPDGTRIAFSSMREGGGIYLISSLGGDERLIARQGRRPQFSPDGKHLTFWLGLEQPETSGRLFVMATTGGDPTRLQPDFRRGKYPIWSPDGKHILFLGLTGLRAEDYAWWVTPLDGGAAVRTGAFGVFRNLGLSEYDIPAMWTAEGHVLFSARLGDSSNLWQIPISPGVWQVSGPPQRLTFGSGSESQPSQTRSGLLVFSSFALNIDVWSLPTDTNRGQARGEPQRLTQDEAADIRPYISADGKKLVFQSAPSGNQDIWMKDLDSGRETALTVTPSDEISPVIARSGANVAYETIEKQKRPISVVPIGPGGMPGLAERICEDCGDPGDWSVGGSLILFTRWTTPVGASLLEVASGKITEPVYPARNVLSPQWSLDNRWVSFHWSQGPLARRIFIVPFRPDVGTPPGEDEWIPITDGLGLDRETAWAPDGNLLYFLSERDGFRCIWAQRLEPATKRPAGNPFPVYHSHGARLSLWNFSNTSWAGLSVARDKLVFSMGERTGNVWMKEPGNK